MRNAFTIGLMGLALLASCSRKNESPVIARIGKAVLTQDDLYRSLPPEYTDRISRDLAVRYVKQWVNTELLYQEALRRKVHKDNDVRLRLERTRKDLLAAEIIRRTSSSERAPDITEKMIVEYYEAHKASFVRQRDVIKVLEMVVPDLKTAHQVRTQATSDNVLELAVRFSRSPVRDPRAVPYVAVADLPPAVAQAVLPIGSGATTGPIPTTAGYLLIHVFDKQKAGTVCSIEEVRGEIVNNLAADLKKTEIDQLLSQLRLIQDVELNLDAIPDPGAQIDSLQSGGTK